MKFFAASLVLTAIALLPSEVFANVIHFGAWQSPVGAAYAITNDPSGNMIVAMSIASNGELFSVSTISAGGRGIHGLSTPIGPDAIFSQGAIQVNTEAKILVTVNPASNTVAMFKIDPYSPTRLTMVGSPVDSGGEFPVSVVINKRATTACVLNSGTVNGVNCYNIDYAKGLVPKSDGLRSLGLNQTSPATGPQGTASHIIFNKEESKVIVSVKGVPPTPGFLATWDLNNDGSLSEEFTKSIVVSGGLLPFGMTLVPGTNAVLATDPGVGLEVFNFGDVDGLSATSTVTKIPGQGATCWASFSRKSGNFYLTDVLTAIVTEVSIDDNLKGNIVEQYQLGLGSGPIDNTIATIGENNFLYALASNASSIDVLLTNTPGKAVLVQTFHFGRALLSMGVKFTNVNMQGLATFIRN